MTKPAEEARRSGQEEACEGVVHKKGPLGFGPVPRRSGTVEEGQKEASRNPEGAPQRQAVGPTRQSPAWSIQCGVGRCHTVPREAGVQEEPQQGPYSLPGQARKLEEAGLDDRWWVPSGPPGWTTVVPSRLRQAWMHRNTRTRVFPCPDYRSALGVGWSPSP